MQAHYVIKRPMVTEKSTVGADSKRYSFVVDRQATKPDIKSAVESLYNVRVLGVNTQLRKGKVRRTRAGLRDESPVKVAVVRLHPDDTIELI